MRYVQYKPPESKQRTCAALRDGCANFGVLMTTPLFVHPLMCPSLRRSESALCARVRRQWVGTQLGIVLLDLLLILAVPAVPVALAWFVQTQRAVSDVASPLNEISADDILFYPWTITTKFRAIMIQNMGMTRHSVFVTLCGSLSLACLWCLWTAIFLLAALFYLLSFVELVLFYAFEEEDDLTLDQLLTSTRASYSARTTVLARARFIFQSIFYFLYLTFIGTFTAYFALVLVSARALF